MNARSLIALAIKARTRSRVGTKGTFKSYHYLVYSVLRGIVAKYGQKRLIRADLINKPYHWIAYRIPENKDYIISSL